MTKSRPREAADEYLMKHGPTSKAVLYREVSPLFESGRAARRVLRKNETDLRHGDIYEVGRRKLWNELLANAKRNKTWIYEGDLIRHRDWRSPTGWAVPPLAELKPALDSSGFTKWHWAALVAAHVVESESRAHVDPHAKNSMRTPSEFASLGFASLSSKDTVRRYLHIWLDRFDRPSPGEFVEVPPMSEWPKAAKPTPPGVGASQSDREEKPKRPSTGSLLHDRNVGGLCARILDDGGPEFAAQCEEELHRRLVLLRKSKRDRTRTRGGQHLRVVSQ